jgi:hypothetical protein
MFGGYSAFAKPAMPQALAGIAIAPKRQASRTASTFECTPSFARTFLTWL